MARTPYEKELISIVVGRAAGNDNSSVVDNIVRQVLKEKGENEPGRKWYLKRRIGEESLKDIRARKRRGTRPAFELKAV